MKITWVNHASFIFSYKEINLICDPWIENAVFNNSWKLLSPTRLSYNDFEDITHIWFSHEHPDHFLPPNLKKIPEEIRKKITVLYQKTIDRKVIEYCKGLNFKEAIVLTPGKEYALTSEITLLCNKVKNDTDSWLYVKTPDCSFLNVNDCVLSDKELAAINTKIGPPDVLFTQFSYATWAGNKNDRQLRKDAALKKINDIKKQVEAIKPKYVVPFASYVWFAHEENYYMNDEINKVGDIYELLNNMHVQPVVLYPGDTWTLNTKYKSIEALKKYAADYQKIYNNPLLEKVIHIAPDVLKAAAEKYTQRSLSLNNKIKLKSIKPFYAFVSDYNKVLTFSFSEGLREVGNVTKEQCDVELSSDSLKNCFDFMWGFDTVVISGRIQKPAGGNFQHFLEYQWISHLNNMGEKMPNILVRLFRKIFTMISIKQ